jgi:mono/diheme cytochrome c family protein
MLRKRGLRLAAVAATALALGGCETWYNAVPSPDQLWYQIPWFDHMIHQRMVHPYSRADIPRYTPEGAVPVGGGEADWAAEFASGNTSTADALVNPLAGATTIEEAAGRAQLPAADVALLPGTIAARGDTLYQVYCAVCHGPTGAGAAESPVGRQLGAPSILTPQARGRSDGYLYSIVRYGRGVMPRYGDKIFNPIDRWAVVNHVRMLQGGAQAPAAAPAAAGTGGQQ